MTEHPKPLVSVILVVHNGAAWLPPVLDALSEQTYPHIEILLRDNASTDTTVDIVKNYPAINLIQTQENVGPWVGFEYTLPQTKGEYVVLLTDIVMDPDCITRAIASMEGDARIGAVQTKILQMNLHDGQPHYTNLIDTTGFAISRSRRVINRGHGEHDAGQYDHQHDLIAVEGAMPIFRRSALETCRIDGWLVDPTYRVGSIGYGDDLDLMWRMRLLGFRQYYEPTAIAWHDRSTTKDVAHSVGEHLSRVAKRRAMPLQKRRLDWSNVRFTIIKNDAIINVLKDLPWILAREIAVIGYTLLFEPAVFQEAPRFFRLLPQILDHRKKVMARAVATPQEMRALMT